MISSFDLGKLNDLLKDFHNLTGMRITVFDDACREITAWPRQVDPVCQYIRSSPGADDRCRACDRQACATAARQKRTYVYRCHSGLTEAIAPVLMGNVVIAYLLFGHLFCYPTREEGASEILRLCAGNGLDPAELTRLIEGLPLVSEETILSAAHILEAVASFLCLDRMITLKQQPLQVQIDEYITAHFTEDISADTLCRRFGIGRTALYEFSKQNYGMGIAQHIRTLRIGHAMRLLVDQPELNISQIADACGFSDYNYFITVFSRVAGISPRKYRLRAEGEDGGGTGGAQGLCP